MIDLYYWPTPNGHKIPIMLEETGLAYLAGDYSIADMATYPWVHVRWFHEIDIDQFPNVKRWYEAVGERPAVRTGCALLEDAMKIGDPDDQARDALFAAQQVERRI